MTNPIFQRIRTLYSELPHKMRRIADFLLQQQEQSAFLTGKEIASACDTSPATVARFFQVLGYEKFQDFATEIQDLLKERHLPMRKIREVFSFQAQGKEGDSLEQTCLYEHQNIEALLVANEQKRFKEALESMTAASSIYLVGDRSAYGLAHYAGSVLRSFSSKIDFFASGDGLAYERLERLSESDLLIGISFHRYVQSTWKLMRFAYERNVQVLAVTDYASSPLINVSTYYLLAPNEAPFYSYTAATVLFNALIRGYIYHKQEVASEFEARSEMLLDNDVYLKPSDLGNLKRSAQIDNKS